MPRPAEKSLNAPRFTALPAAKLLIKGASRKSRINRMLLLHTHLLGIGVLILLATLAIANLPVSARLQTVLCALVSLGAIYPLGWAVLAWLIPFVGVEALRDPVEWIFFVPFGGALILGLVAAMGLCIIGCLRRTKENDGRGG
jgi:hypothetical protein